MGRRGQKKGSAGNSTGNSSKAAQTNKNSSKEQEESKAANSDQDNLTTEELMGLMFQPMPPNKRAELNSIVEKLLNLSSNYVQDDPTSPAKLYAEFEEIYSLVQKIRAIENQGNMTRRLRGPRKMHVPTFLAWLEKHGAKVRFS